MYWKQGTEPDIYNLGQSNGSIKSKIQAVTWWVTQWLGYLKNLNLQVQLNSWRSKKGFQQEEMSDQ